MVASKSRIGKEVKGQVGRVLLHGRTLRSIVADALFIEAKVDAGGGM